MNNDGKYNICIDICPCEECDCDEEDCVLAQAYQKQIPKKPIRQSTDEKTHFKCICGSIQKTVYKGGYRMGAEREYCPDCGQAIDWRNEDE